MARWIADAWTVADAAAGLPEARYVSGLRSTWGEHGPQRNAFRFARRMHYCTRMLVYHDIALTESGITTEGPPQVYETTRWGDLGSWYVTNRKASANELRYFPETSPEHMFSETSSWSRYRFPAYPFVPLYFLDYYGRTIDPRPPLSAEDHPFNGLTAAWRPGARDTSFWWTPTSDELAAVRARLGDFAETYESTLHLAIIAWLWAGYQQGRSGGPYNPEIPKKGLDPPPADAGYSGIQRAVDEVDVYFSAFVF